MLVDLLDRSVFVRSYGARSDVPIVVLHGFPGSSADWSVVAAALAVDRQVVTFDLPGYGRSSKDPGTSYSLFDQASVVEALMDHLAVERCVLLAHDMGDTVAAELAARSNAGALGFAVEGIVLTNGSIFIEMAQLTRGQKLTLRLPDRPSWFSLPTWVMRRSLLESFTRDCPPPPGAVDALIAQLRLNRGDRLMPVLIRYIEERRVHQERWTAGLVEYDGPLSAIWGEQDPIAVLAMTEKLATLRPATTVVTLPGVGHWPSLEAPDRLAAAVLAQLGPAGSAE